MDAYTRLLAAQMHESEGAQSPIEITRIDTPRDRDGVRWTHLRAGLVTVVIQWPRKQTPVVSLIDMGIRTADDIDSVIALFQMAREIIGGGA